MEISNLKCKNDNILVEIKKESERESSGLILLDKESELTVTGKVLSKGPGVKNVDMSQFTEGSNVVIRKNCGTTYTEDSKVEYRFIKASDVMAEF